MSLLLANAFLMGCVCPAIQMAIPIVFQGGLLVLPRAFKSIPIFIGMMLALHHAFSAWRGLHIIPNFSFENHSCFSPISTKLQDPIGSVGVAGGS